MGENRGFSTSGVDLVESVTLVPSLSSKLMYFAAYFVVFVTNTSAKEQLWLSLLMSCTVK